MDETTLHKEIDLIQGVINRLANNSFLLKGWTVTLIIAVLALTKDTLVNENVIYFSFILLLPLFVFWYLDAFFLHKEKCYLELYNWVIVNRPTSEEYKYDLNYKRFIDKVDSIFKVMMTPTIGIFYGTIILILNGIVVYNLL